MGAANGYRNALTRSVAPAKHRVQVEPAKSRLRIVLLKHIPFKVLWTLTEYGQDLEGCESIPGLDELLEPLLVVEREMNRPHSRGPLEKFSLGARGRTNTY